MKKLALLISIVIMVFGSSMITFAQPSVDVNGTITVHKATGKNGKKVKIVISDVNDNEQKLIDEVLKPKNLKELLGDAYSSKYQVVGSASVYVLDEKTGEKIDYKNAKGLFPVSITFNVPGVTVGSKVQVLHYYGGKWHVTDVEVTDGKVAGVFDELSPFVFLVEKNTVENGAPNSGSTSTITSPETGDSNVAMYVAVVAAIAFTGVVVTRKKKTA